MPVYTYILISTKNDSLFFVKKLKFFAVHSPAQPDNTGIYTPHLSDKNHGLYEIITMI